MLFDGDHISDYKNGVLIGPKANSDWLYVVPWGLYKALMYVKERYGNPTVILSENGISSNVLSVLFWYQILGFEF